MMDKDDMTDTTILCPGCGHPARPHTADTIYCGRCRKEYEAPLFDQSVYERLIADGALFGIRTHPGGRLDESTPGFFTIKGAKKGKSKR